MMVGINTHRGRIFLNTDSIILIPELSSIISQGIEFFVNSQDFNDLMTYMNLIPDKLKKYSPTEGEKRVAQLEKEFKQIKKKKSKKGTKK